MAIAGLGVMGRDHLKNALTLQQEGLLRLVGLADVEVERARARRAWRARGAGTSLPSPTPALLEETCPDFVVVATPHLSHEEVIGRRRAGGARPVREADRPYGGRRPHDRGLPAGGGAAGDRLQPAHDPGLHPGPPFPGRGPARTCTGSASWPAGGTARRPTNDSGGWRGTWDGEGGGAMNQAPHHLDLYCWLAGPLPAGEGHRPDPGSTRSTWREIPSPPSWSMENRGVDTFYTTTAEWPGRTEFLFAGERGRLLVAERQLRLYRPGALPWEELLQAPHGSKPAGAWEEIEVQPAPPGTAGHLGLLRRSPRRCARGARRTSSPAARTGATPWSWPTPCCWRLTTSWVAARALPIDRGAQGGAAAGARRRAERGRGSEAPALRPAGAGAGHLPEGT